MTVFYLLLSILKEFCYGGAVTPKIVGGRNANIKDYPSYVAIMHQTSYETRFMCGGTYIHRLWVVTAAHCIYSSLSGLEKPKRVRLRMGISALEEKGQERRAVYLIKFPSYPEMQEITYHDIGLVKIDRKFDFEMGVAIATLVRTYPFSRKVIIVGFGSTVVAEDIDEAVISVRLQKVELTIESMDEDYLTCRDPTPKGSCFGDSGGPMYLRENVTLVGVVSSGICKSGLGLYVNVYGYRRWIRETIQGVKSIGSHCETVFKSYSLFCTVFTSLLYYIKYS